MIDYKLPAGAEPHVSRYIRFISTRNPPDKLKGRAKGYERHHILPRSLGGLDVAENLIKLTPREHFIAHILLWKAYGEKMTKALWYMSNRDGYKSLTSRQYENLRLEQAEESSRTNKGRLVGDKNPMYGKNHTEDWKAWARDYFGGNRNPNFGKQGNLGSRWNWSEEQRSKLKEVRAKQKPYSRDNSSGRKWMINRSTMHQCTVKPGDFDIYKENGYEFGRISPPQPKRKK
mgnify:CR=1 FL=1